MRSSSTLHPGRGENPPGHLIQSNPMRIGRVAGIGVGVVVETEKIVEMYLDAREKTRKLDVTEPEAALRREMAGLGARAWPTEKRSGR